VSEHPGYLRDDLRIRFSRKPDWMAIDKFGGTASPWAADTTHVTLNPGGLPDGTYEGQIRVLSNDPARPDVSTAPIELHVGVNRDEPADFLTSTITSSTLGPLIEVRVNRIQPNGFILNSSLHAERVVLRYSGYLSSTPDWTNVKFPLLPLGELLSEGPSVNARVMGELYKQTWFEQTDQIRFLRPSNIAPATILPHGVSGPPAQFAVNSTVPLTWVTPSGITNARHDVWLSRDQGVNWVEIGHDLSSASLSWLVTGPATATAKLGIVVRDNDGLVGSWTSAPFEITGGAGPLSAEPVVLNALPRVESLVFANPVRGGSDLRLALPRGGRVELKLYDVRGAEAARIASGEYEAGEHVLRWEAANRRLSPGVYFLRATLPNATLVRRVVLLR
jgi:hypothetical protein